MENPIETINYEGYTIKIYSDSYVDSPRSWDNFGKMALFHGKYKFPNELNMSIEECKCLESNKDWLVLPVYMIDHSSVALSTEPFNDPWDSGRVGIIAVEKSKVLEQLPENLPLKGYSRTQIAFDMLEDEVRSYSRYVNGETYGYEIEDKSGEKLDSCWGYLGLKSVIACAKEDVDEYIKSS